MSRSSAILALAAATVLAAAPAFAAGEDDDDHLAARDGVRVLHAWVNATDDDHALLFMEIENGGSAEVTLTGAATAIADGATLVALPPSGDPGAAEPLGALPIPAGSEMDLAPGGVFFELRGLTQTLVEGEAFDVTITLDPIGALDIHVDIEAADATRHSHAGHTH